MQDLARPPSDGGHGGEELDEQLHHVAHAKHLAQALNKQSPASWYRNDSNDDDDDDDGDVQQD